MILKIFKKKINISRRVLTIIMSVVNGVVISAILVSLLLLSIRESKLSDKQNLTDINNITLSSAETADSAFVARERAINNIITYQNNLGSYAVDLFVQFVNNYYTNEAIYDFQLLDETGKGYIITGKEHFFVEYQYDVDYTDESYYEIRKICTQLKHDTVPQVFGYTKEFTNKENGLRSFAYYGFLTMNDTTNTRKNYLLMAVISSDQMVNQISRNTTYDNMVTAIANENGDFVVSNLSFYSSNVYDYITLNNDLSVEDRQNLKLDVTSNKNSSKVFLNNLGQKTIYTFAKMENEKYYVVTSVPVSNFVNIENYYAFMYSSFILIIILFAGDVAYLFTLNKRLKESMAEEKKANSTKSDFLSRMSHDIRTPMNGIMGMIQICEKNMDDKMLMRDSMAKIKQSSSYLLSLINDILDMNKLENGKVELRNESVNLKDVFNNCISIVNAQIKEKNLTIIPYIQENIHCNVFASQLHIRQIMLNLLSNAIKYNKENGRIYFNMEENHYLGNKVTIKIVVTDTGVGMSEEFQKIVFEPFTQENQGARTKYGGSGLGMSIVKKIVDLMEGSISVSSKVNEGTTFTVFLPFEIDNDSKNRMKPEIRKELPDLKGKKILLVEDNEINMEIASFILEDLGVVLDTAINGQEAVEKFIMSDKEYFDAIIMDIMMPVMDGHEASRTIRSLTRKDAKTIPIIAMTANAFEEDIQKAMEAGMNAHLAKPINKEKLVDTLIKLLQKN